MTSLNTHIPARMCVRWIVLNMQNVNLEKIAFIVFFIYYYYFFYFFAFAFIFYVNEERLMDEMINWEKMLMKKSRNCITLQEKQINY